MDRKTSDGVEGAERPRPVRILIADDSLSSRELLRFILESSGYEVVDAENGEQALEIAVALRPDLVILDLQMPKLNGCEAAAALRKIPAFETTPIVALTAGSRGGHKRIEEAGFTSYIAKPIGPARLRRCVENLL